jgi:hypothetical protein
MLEARPTSWYEARIVICPFLSNSLMNILARKLNCKTVMYSYGISDFQVRDILFLMGSMVATYYLS